MSQVQWPVASPVTSPVARGGGDFDSDSDSDSDGDSVTGAEVFLTSVTWVSTGGVSSI